MNFDSQNIFSQTFASEPPQQIGLVGVVDQNQAPFLNSSNPPKSAKYGAKGKEKKSQLGFMRSPNSSAFKGSSFSDTFHLQGPLKSSRLIPKERLEDGLSEFGTK